MRGRLGKILRRLAAGVLAPDSFNGGKGEERGSFGPCLTADLDENLEVLAGFLGRGPDLVVRRLEAGPPGRSLRAALLYLEGLVDADLLGESVLEPVLHRLSEKMAGRPADLDFLDFLAGHVLTASSVKRLRTVEDIAGEILRGGVALLVDRHPAALLASLTAFEARSVEEPTLETVIRGPKEGFTESIRTNLALLRRKIAHPGLRFTEVVLGRYTRTRVVVAHVEGIAGKELVAEVLRRISGIDIDGVIDSGYVEQLIEDAPYSLFPTIGNTEKPDVVAARLLEGKVAVLVDGSPVALTMPRLFYETVQTPEDYYSRPYNSSLIRLIRLFFLAVSVLLPAFYVAAVNFDPEMIPFKLVVTIAAAREGVPFPLVLEVVFFGVLFEGLREAGVRLPRPVGQAVTIVGALIIGTAAVDAGLVSSVTVIVTALVGIAGFITPGFTDVYIFSRVVLVLLSGLLGFFGLVLGLMFFYTHLCSLRSFGVPYMTPIAPAEYRGWKDVFVRAPLWLLSTRPPFLAKGNVRRMGPGAKPRPPRPPRGGDREEGTF
ncbi:MAG: spore germination protein [Desulfotomaculales bacterium]